MGNTALQRDYAVSDVVSASGGNGHLWRVYPAVHKATKQEVCVFVCIIVHWAGIVVIIIIFRIFKNNNNF